MIIEFDSLKHALEEAVWCAETYATRQAIIHINGRYGVCGADEADSLRDVLEILTPKGGLQCQIKNLL